VPVSKAVRGGREKFKLASLEVNKTAATAVHLYDYDPALSSILPEK